MKTKLKNLQIVSHLRVRQEETRTVKMHANQTIESKSILFGIKHLEFQPSAWTTETYAYICGGILASLFVITLIRSVIFFNFCASASQNLHDTMFRGVISTTLRFFDLNPSGRIMNRFSKDLGSADEALPKAFLDAIQINLTMVGAILVTVYTNINFTIVIFIMFVLFWMVRKFYLKSSTNIKRLEGTSKSTITICLLHRSF